MTVEVVPSLRCNLQCRYCYEKTLRDNTEGYNIDKMIAAAKKEGDGGFSVFGGEPLLLPLADLERLWSANPKGRNTIQTNGTLITDEHLPAFRKWDVHVGFSIDGPDELNAPRSSNVLTTTSCAWLERLIREKYRCSVMTTLHRANASPERIDHLVSWFGHLGKLGLRHVRLHTMQRVDGVEDLILPDEEAVAAFLRLRVAFADSGIDQDTFFMLAQLLRGKEDGLVCVWNCCDPWNTTGLSAIRGDGTVRGCVRPNTAREWPKAKDFQYVRQLALYETPQADGGCKDCRFFFVCKGSCPGHAIDNDWRNRSADCDVLRRLFEIVERELVLLGEEPVTLCARRAEREKAMLAAWESGKRGTSLRDGHADVPHGDRHGDHWDTRNARRSER